MRRDPEPGHTRTLMAVMAFGDMVFSQKVEEIAPPSGHAVRALEFARGHLRDAAMRDAFRYRLGREEVGNNGSPEREHLWAMWASVGAACDLGDRGRVSQSLGGADLKFLCHIFRCEWAYVIDVDASTLQVFEGKPGPVTSNIHDGYVPIRRRKTWSLDHLPTTTQFLDELREARYEEEAVEETLKSRIARHRESGMMLGYGRARDAADQRDAAEERAKYAPMIDDANEVSS